METEITDILDVEVDTSFELEAHHKENKLLYYRPCCTVHFDPEQENPDGSKGAMICPTAPCPDSKHWSLHMSPQRIRCVFGGNRSGKTLSCLSEFLLSSTLKTHPYRKTKNPYPGKFRIYSSDFGILEKLIIPKVKEFIPRNALRYVGKSKDEAWALSYDPRFHILELQGDGMIDFMSYDQETSKSASVELDGIFADEEMPENMYTEAMSRLISRNGFFLLGVTPLYDLSWAMKFMETQDPQVQLFHFEIYDNPFISKKAIQEFEDSIPEHEKEARIHGRFLELQGLVYKELRADIHLLADDHPKPGSPVIFALDPHPRKPSVMTWAYVTNKEDIVFFDELEMGGTAKEIVNAIKYKESTHKGRVHLRLIDPAAKAQGSNIAFESDTLKEFEKEGMGFTLADNSDAGYNIVHEYLGFDKTRPLSSLNRPRAYFTKNTPKTWYGMTHLLWEEWNSKKQLRDKKERVKEYKKDFPDAVKYTLASRPCLRMFQNINPVPLKLSIGGTQKISKVRMFQNRQLAHI